MILTRKIAAIRKRSTVLSILLREDCPLVDFPQVIRSEGGDLEFFKRSLDLNFKIKGSTFSDTRAVASLLFYSKFFRFGNKELGERSEDKDEPSIPK